MLIKSDTIKDTSYLLTQTPPNYPTERNYYLKQLQDKINQDWRFRPNRISIEEEEFPGEEKYSPEEVVVQNIIGEKGEAISDDWKRLVFRELTKKLRLGTRYRFSSDFDICRPDEEKNIWIAINQDKVQETSSQVVVRCNGTLGSLYKDKNGNVSVHYEPVVQDPSLQGTTFGFNTVAIDPRGSMKIIAQFNKYTEQYYINQRFVIGYDRVFKVQNISRHSTLTTYNSKDIPIVTLYLQMDQVGQLDDMEKRIAYNGNNDKVVKEIPSEEEFFEIRITNPNPIPLFLYKTPLDIEAYIFSGEQKEELEVYADYWIDGVEDVSKYITFEKRDNVFSFSRNRFFGGGPLNIKFYIKSEDSPIGEEINKTIKLNLGGME